MCGLEAIEYITISKSVNQYTSYPGIFTKVLFSDLKLCLLSCRLTNNREYNNQCINIDHAAIFRNWGVKL